MPTNRQAWEPTGRTGAASRQSANSLHGTERSATNKLAWKKEKPKKRKKECKTEGVNRATRKVFWGKYSFRAKRGKEDFPQKPEGLDLAGARREANFAIPFWLCSFCKAVFLSKSPSIH
ncbi:MAG: hypothetical protein J6W13_01555 [Salinivirgaceae bacterium]|nr:hypothetical protein [Salinivirgaceae bacterium]